MKYFVKSILDMLIDFVFCWVTHKLIEYFWEFYSIFQKIWFYFFF